MTTGRETTIIPEKQASSKKFDEAFAWFKQNAELLGVAGKDDVGRVLHMANTGSEASKNKFIEMVNDIREMFRSGATSSDVQNYLTVRLLKALTEPLEFYEKLESMRTDLLTPETVRLGFQDALEEFDKHVGPEAGEADTKMVKETVVAFASSDDETMNVFLGGMTLVKVAVENGKITKEEGSKYIAGLMMSIVQKMAERAFTDMLGMLR